MVSAISTSGEYLEEEVEDEDGDDAATLEDAELSDLPLDQLKLSLTVSFCLISLALVW